MQGDLRGLNPCCNGCRTWTNYRTLLNDDLQVLILVVMDVALGPKNF